MAAKNKTRHTTLTPSAAKVVAILRRAGFRPHPGTINPRGGHGGTMRIKITSEPGRTRIRVAGGGVQEVYLYGPVEPTRIIDALQRHLGSGVVQQDGEGEDH
ncbi:MAG: hypothetical protein HQL82_02240 [Magnetococcales bacterium]|nr:hypothetical protein [Magnetococcales bacterium]